MDGKKKRNVEENIWCKELTKEELKVAGELGKKNEDAAFEKIKERFDEMEKDNPKYKDEGIKNIKTNRSQWFD